MLGPRNDSANLYTDVIAEAFAFGIRHMTGF
jgi:hypothetical protein